MSDRLAELLRQRTLIEEHLAWLNREIASASKSETAGKQPAAVPLVTRTPGPASPTRGAPPAALPADVVEVQRASKVAAAGTSPAAEEILEQYRVPNASMHDSVRKGCLLYFAAAFVALVLLVAVLYFALRSR